MQELMLVCFPKSACHPLHDLGSLQGFHFFAVDGAIKCVPIDELHNQIEHSCHLSEIVDPDQIGVAELGHGTGLDLEAFSKGLDRGKFGRKHLDCNVPAE